MGKPAHTPLVDSFGRVIEDLRISVTDRCNFRCTYCMPEEGLEWLDRSDVMSFEEIEQLARLFVERFGVRGIRLTGGEPTVRAQLPRLVERLATLGNDHGPVDLAMTTNGVSLPLVAEELQKAGLKRVNISLDSLQRERFLELTRRDDLDRVWNRSDAHFSFGVDRQGIQKEIPSGMASKHPGVQGAGPSIRVIVPGSSI